MAYLTRREEEAWKRGDIVEARRLLEVERKFLEEHLVEWVPKFCSTIRELGGEKFYRGVAELTEAFLREDEESVRELLSESQ